ncbi:hypothetical protein [Zobellia roscoffensis]|uniref:hypothetical protein n=1 Tax=Zobellia roscoffensis TaxID=2779508 RepID=UPI00188A76FE|nr:hypothetical protein [Zobellia roscoffensis]
MKYFFFSLILLFSSCKGQEKSVGKDEESKVGDQLQLVESDNYSGSDAEEFLVISEIKTLQKFYSNVNRTRKPGLPIPQIDFTKEILIIYCAGKQQNSFEPILSIKSETKNTLVLAIENSNVIHTSTSTTTPFSIYKLPLTKKEIILE